MSVVHKPSGPSVGNVCLVRRLEYLLDIKKTMRVKVTDECCCKEIPAMFELSSDVMETHQLLSPSTRTCLDKDNQFTMVLGNHRCGPVYLQY